MKGKWVRSFRGGIILLLMIVLVLGLSACGGSNNKDTSSAADMKKASMENSLGNVAFEDQIAIPSSSSLANSEMAPAAQASSAPQEAREGDTESGNEASASAMGGGIGPI